MPDSIDNTPIVIRAPSPANPFLYIWDMMNRAMADPIQVNIVEPLVGNVDDNSIWVQWDGPLPPPKPTLIENQMKNLRDAYLRVGAVIANLSDTDEFTFGSVTLSGEEIKSWYFALKVITVTEERYMKGYGGQNLRTELQIGWNTSSWYGTFGDVGYNYLMIHELTHDTTPGTALLQQMYDRHIANGGKRDDYGLGNPYFELQEAMTNSLGKELADQLGIVVEGSDPSLPRYGYYNGDELEQ